VALEKEDSFAEAGAEQDRAAVTSIQRNLASNPHEYFEFGLFEGAIGHFHRQLSAVIDERVNG
jgi:hypothetical protein